VRRRDNHHWEPPEASSSLAKLSTKVSAARC
jgi:hypothetical protein